VAVSVPYDERERTPATDAYGIAERPSGECGDPLHSPVVQVNVKLADRRGFAFTMRDMREP